MPFVGGKTITTNPTYQRTYQTAGGWGVTNDRQPVPNEIIDPENFRIASEAFSNAVTHTKIADLNTDMAYAQDPVSAAPAPNMNNLILIGGLILLGYMLMKGRF